MKRLEKNKINAMPLQPLQRNLKSYKMLSGALELRIGEIGQRSNVRRLPGRKREESTEMPQFTVNTPR